MSGSLSGILGKDLAAHEDKSRQQKLPEKNVSLEGRQVVWQQSSELGQSWGSRIVGHVGHQQGHRRPCRVSVGLGSHIRMPQTGCLKYF